ncbi:MAG: hypothetical protein B6U94_05215 [Thermofilum sp. ex4484_79]|nr:MAG: hypothetical protein B6U94_05215 [Thermofilum sp. ex4484_79]
MDKVRFGVIGCGTVAGYGHIPAVVNSEKAELVALADVNAKRLGEMREKYGVDTYTEYIDLLKRNDVDAVIVATPTFTHCKIVSDAAKMKKHILCEKPISLSLEEADEMIKVTRENNVKFMIGFTKRSSKRYIKIKELVNSGEIGELRFIKQISNWGGPIWGGEERYLWMINRGGGPLIDAAIHDFDLLRWYSGSEVSSVYTTGYYSKKNIVYPDNVFVLVNMRNGIAGYIEHSWAYGKKGITEFHVVGTEGVIIMGDKEAEVVKGDEVRRIVIGDDEDRFLVQVNNFVESIVEDKEPPVTGVDGKKALEIALAALESFRNKKVMFL